MLWKQTPSEKQVPFLHGLELLAPSQEETTTVVVEVVVVVLVVVVTVVAVVAVTVSKQTPCEHEPDAPVVVVHEAPSDTEAPKKQ